MGPSPLLKNEQKWLAKAKVEVQQIQDRSGKQEARQEGHGEVEAAVGMNHRSFVLLLCSLGCKRKGRKGRLG